MTCMAITAENGKNRLDTTDSKNVIHCTTADLCTSAAGSNSAGKAYIDSRETDVKQINVITCNDDGCTSSTSITTGHAYIDVKDKDNGYKRVIICNSDYGCIHDVGTTKDDYMYIDAIPSGD